MSSDFLIGWKLASLKPDVASIRYRAMIPILALEDRGVRARIFSVASPENLDGLNCLVIVKSFTPDDLYLVYEAVKRQIPVVIDLCDNIFIDGYGNKKGINTISPSIFFEQMAKFANVIVVTTEPLAKIVRDRVKKTVQTVVIPDGIEDTNLFKLLTKKLLAAANDEREGHFRKAKRKIAMLYRKVGMLSSAEIGPFLYGVVKDRLELRRNLLLHAKGAITKPSNVASKNRIDTSNSLAEGNIVSLGKSNTQRILWFGIHGAQHAQFGILDILQVKKALVEIAAELTVELVVVSNNRKKYEMYIKPLAIPSRYVEWSSEALAAEMALASVVIIPNSRDAFSMCKSSNRAVLSLLNGLPVVATKTPALCDLEGCVIFDDFKFGIREYLRNRSKAIEDIQKARGLIRALYGADVISSKWIDVIEKALRRPTLHVPKERVAVVIQLQTDWDLIAPLIKEFQSRGIGIIAYVNNQLLKNGSMICQALNAMSISILPVSHEYTKFSYIPESVKALVSASESSLYPHKMAHRLTLMGNKSGIYTATMQHGYENAGLTYHDAFHSARKISFASQRIYLWGSTSTLSNEVPRRTVNKCISVGCTRQLNDDSQLIDLTDIAGGKKIIGIFENLHWHRYSKKYREFFVEGVMLLATTFRHITFLLKAHPTGNWLTGQEGGALARIPNIVLGIPDRCEWAKYPANRIIPNFCGVISTLSSVTLDAARNGLPVAVVSEDLAAERYTPLYTIKVLDDWTRFVRILGKESGPEVLKIKSAQFLERAIVSGNSTQSIFDDIAIHI